jgi:hypothetical protein
MKYRGQHVKLILKVPVGKSVFLKQGSRHIIYDIKNVTNTYDGDMIGKTWTMTEDGLECKTCNFSKWEYNYDSNEEHDLDDAHIHIDESGVHIKAKGVRDSDFHKKDVNISIDENGVVIDSKNK